MPLMEIKNSDAAAVTGNGNVLLDFYTPTCGPCRAMHPVLEELANEYQSNITIAKVEVTKNPEISARFDVMSVPTVILMVNSKVKEVLTGFPGKAALKSMVKKHFGTPAVTCG